MSTKKIYSIDQVKAHGHLMQNRFRDRSLKFEYYDLKMGWQDASVPQWVAETRYRAVASDGKDTLQIKYNNSLII